MLHLCLAGEAGADEALRDRCAHVEGVVLDRRGGGLWRTRARVYGWLALGRPIWVSEVTSRTFAERARALVTRWRPDILHIGYPVMAQYAPRGLSRAPRLLIEPDPGVHAAQGFRDSTEGLRRLLRTLDVLAWRRYSRLAASRTDVTVVFTEKDRRAMSETLPSGTRLAVIPLGTLIPATALDPRGRPPPHLIFVGNFTHPPNVDAAIRLAGRIFPRLRQGRQELTLALVGHDPPPAVRSLAGAGVDVQADVPDVLPYLDRACVVVVPLSSGGGMRVKVIEAVAAGKAIVASPMAAEGLELLGGVHILLAESDGDFCRAVECLLDDGEARARLARSAREWALANLDWRSGVDRYELLYAELLAGEAPAR